MAQTNFLSSVAEIPANKGDRYAAGHTVCQERRYPGRLPGVWRRSTQSSHRSPFFVSNVEVFWEYPDAARWLLRLASFARVAMFDKRGTGMSDRVTERGRATQVGRMPSPESL
jgi:hypothetical protein